MLQGRYKGVPSKLLLPHSSGLHAKGAMHAAAPSLVTQRQWQQGGRAFNLAFLSRPFKGELRGCGKFHREVGFFSNVVFFFRRVHPSDLFYRVARRRQIGAGRCFFFMQGTAKERKNQG